MKIAIADAADMDVDTFVFNPGGQPGGAAARGAAGQSRPPVAVQARPAPDLHAAGGEYGAGSALNVTVWDSVPAGTTFPHRDGRRRLQRHDGWSGPPARCPRPRRRGWRSPCPWTASRPGGLWNAGRLSWMAGAATSFADSPGVATAGLARSPVLHKDRDPRGPGLPGQPLTYRVSWADAGSGTVDTLVLTDTLPAGLAVVTPSLAAWAQPDWLGTPAVTASAWAATAAGPWTAGEAAQRDRRTRGCCAGW